MESKMKIPDWPWERTVILKKKGGGNEEGHGRGDGAVHSWERYPNKRCCRHFWTSFPLSEEIYSGSKYYPPRRIKGAVWGMREATPWAACGEAISPGLFDRNLDESWHRISPDDLLWKDVQLALKIGSFLDCFLNCHEVAVKKLSHWEGVSVRTHPYPEGSATARKSPGSLGFIYWQSFGEYLQTESRRSCKQLYRITRGQKEKHGSHWRQDDREQHLWSQGS